jgi:hypothetical protein
MCRNISVMAVLVCLILLLMNEDAIAQNQWNTYRDNSLKFRFLYPADWIDGTPRGENVKTSLFAPQGFPSANCNIVVRSFPEIKEMTQTQLNEEIIGGGELTATDWKGMLGGKWPEMKLIDTKIVKVDNQPAYFGIIEFCHETLDRKTFMKDMLLMTLTPGRMWIFTCSAKGTSIEESRISFDHWQSTFQRILGSLVFERW